MTTETIQILKDMGFIRGEASFPAHFELGLQLTIKRNGAGTIIFCNGGVAEYELLANHGAINRKREMQTVCAGDVPYLTINLPKLARVFLSIATMRILNVGTKEQKRAHQKLARQCALRWINQIPAETNDLYMREEAGNFLAEALSVKDRFSADERETESEQAVPLDEPTLVGVVA